MSTSAAVEVMDGVGASGQGEQAKAHAEGAATATSMLQSSIPDLSDSALGMAPPEPDLIFDGSEMSPSMLELFLSDSNTNPLTPETAAYASEIGGCTTYEIPQVSVTASEESLLSGTFLFPAEFIIFNAIMQPTKRYYDEVIRPSSAEQ
ncbi:hypothetical protein ONZ43_g5677 [Nemania bipapillata]|uniref:Uncharacterized protein n=1 Tax=Nemania bipapillata TaxID=110536 RepID=A0ACC2I7N8_9PEZI|nr:hypothetical protein ONZ43_g5677 [Nemania bipapillata]